MNTPGINTGNGNDPHEEKLKIIKTIKESKKSSSDIYQLIWMNSNVTGVKVNRTTCGALLSHLQTWKDLPARIRELILDDIANYMGNDCLPMQGDVEKQIAEHPTVILYLEGTLPPESDHQYRTEAEERRKRASDIAMLRIRTVNEVKYVESRMKVDEVPQWDEETPTTPRHEDLQLRPYSESFYQSYLGLKGEDDDIEFPEK